MTIGTKDRPLRVAIIGSGPSGFFAAESLLKSLVICSVDMFDRLPTPYGLVRGGVAPDHPKIRTVSRIFEKTAAHERFHFWGNVTIGRNITVPELQEHYDVILFACGAESDSAMGIPGEDLPGSHSATAFVGWYNGHPDFREYAFDLQQERAVIIGMGNVAMDAARMLTKSVDELRDTDIAAHALDALAESKIREVHLIGRRGPAQFKITLPELKEIGELDGVCPVVSKEALALAPACQEEINTPDTIRILEVLDDYSKRSPKASDRKIIFHFLESPVELRGEGRVESILLEKNQLTGPAFQQKAWGTGETRALATGLVLRSIGYRGIAIPGVPFHDRLGVFPNTEGRIEDNGRVVPGLYCAGWIKRGPSGIIGTNKPDSLETVKAVLSDVHAMTPCPKPDSQAVADLLADRRIPVVSFDDWRRIDAEEQARGAAVGKIRERFTRIDEVLRFLGKI